MCQDRAQPRNNKIEGKVTEMLVMGKAVLILHDSILGDNGGVGAAWSLRLRCHPISIEFNPINANSSRPIQPVDDYR